MPGELIGDETEEETVGAKSQSLKVLHAILFHFIRISHRYPSRGNFQVHGNEIFYCQVKEMMSQGCVK